MRLKIVVKRTVVFEVIIMKLGIKVGRNMEL